MTSPQWRRVDELLDQAMELPTAERAAFLDRECDGDNALRREVESLLAAHDQASGYFDSQPAAIADDLIRDRQAEALVGHAIGPYRIVREIGRGGMGVVYLAERTDDQYRRQVAVKLLWPGLLNTEIIRRFRRERQILANLDHPNVAKLFDGGTTEEGWPYFVMEYVAGQPITEYCNARRLSVAGRLRLFQQVCAAVQYAHQTLIIHRDLKPGNILVTEDGTAKLLDFGIAKLLDPVRQGITAQPTTNALMMTPDYASPEQMRGEPITTASDVYSLGILLYELLTGGHPYQIKDRSLPELVRVVCEQEPEAPSQRVGQFDKLPHGFGDTKPERLRAQLRGDLDQITQTAIQKDANIRYRSVEQLSEDLRRHLEGLPITARKASLAYRTEKFVRRNSVGVSAAALIFLTLLGGIVATARQASIAQRERGRAEQQASEAGRQKAFAETQAAEALRQKTLAETKSNEAEENSARAEEQQRLAEQQRLLAEEQRTLALDQAERNRRLLYAAQMNLAGQAWDDNNLGRTEELVNLHRQVGTQVSDQDLRGFEWYYLWRLLNGNGWLLKMDNEEQQIWDAAFSPDGKRLAAATDAGMVFLWDTTTGTRLDVLKGHTRHVRHLAFSPDGQTLASASADFTTRLWEIPAGREKLVLKGHTNWVTTVAYSPDGMRLATGSRDGTWRLWDVATGRELMAVQSQSPWVNALAFSSDGKVLATGLASAPSIKLWDAMTGRPVAILEGQGSIWSVAFSPDGKWLVTGSKDRTVKVWDVKNGREIATLRGHAGEVRTVAFSPDSQIVASGADDRIVKFWNVRSGVEFAQLKGHNSEIFAVAFSTDGNRMLSGDTDGIVKVWDVAKATEFSLFKPGISSAQSGLTAKTGQERIFALAFSPDGKNLVTGGNGARLWEVATGREQAVFKSHDTQVMAVAFAPDGKTIATGGADRKVKLWDRASARELLTFSGHDGPLTAVAFTVDSQRIISGNHQSINAGIRVWETATGRELLLVKGTVRAAALSTNGRYIAVSMIYPKRETKLLDIGTGRELENFNIPTNALSLAFSPNGKILALGYEHSSIKLLEVTTGRQLASLTGHASFVGSVVFSPDGRRMATGGAEGLVRLWDVENGVELVTFRGHTDQVTSVAFSPNGQILASASLDGTVRFWRAATKEEVAARGRQSAARN